MLIAFLAAAAATPAIDETKLVDLTHAFDDKAIYWPTAKPFTWEKESWGRNAQGDWNPAGRYSASEHGGTHLDRPDHRYRRVAAARPTRIIPRSAMPWLS